MKDLIALARAVLEGRLYVEVEYHPRHQHPGMHVKSYRVVIRP